ncbi:hypothetical protein CcCBS67573_g10217 [Chytriomyces confervae]|uniref:Uncharacterized protein n=1 Tax=Chytriomyces confervae TaxID=246404 RepID=A0A507D9A1_9FUNG|nr:hypothetical protein CcCBS67573_g10217 [Chytriomyces confervae]
MVSARLGESTFLTIPSRPLVCAWGSCFFRWGFCVVLG